MAQTTRKRRKDDLRKVGRGVRTAPVQLSEGMTEPSYNFAFSYAFFRE
jgi:hypothetical protein